MKALNNNFANDSIHAQFSDSVNAVGADLSHRVHRRRELRPGGAPGERQRHPRGLGWADPGWNGAGRHIYFATSGKHTLRIQEREDGVTINQIVLSPERS